MAPTAAEVRKRKGVAGYFDDVSNGLSTTAAGYWQVIEIREDARTPGQFTLWAFTAEKKLQVCMPPAHEILSQPCFCC
jgi:hypothetical protein